MEEIKLTFGEQLVGYRFNPSGDSEVDVIKKAFAQFILSLIEYFNNESSRNRITNHICP